MIAYRFITWVWSLVVGFSLTDYYLPNLPFFVHWFTIGLVAGIFLFITLGVEYFATELRERA